MTYLEEFLESLELPSLLFPLPFLRNSIEVRGSTVKWSMRARGEILLKLVIFVIFLFLKKLFWPLIFDFKERICPIFVLVFFQLLLV